MAVAGTSDPARRRDRDPLMRMIQDRAAVLVERVETIERAEAVGEGASAHVELRLLADEMRFLRALGGELVHVREMEAIERCCARVGERLREER